MQAAAAKVIRGPFLSNTCSSLCGPMMRTHLQMAAAIAARVGRRARRNRGFDLRSCMSLHRRAEGVFAQCPVPRQHPCHATPAPDKHKHLLRRSACACFHVE
jgi:hypothetical protein